MFAIEFTKQFKCPFCLTANKVEGNTYDRYPYIEIEPFICSKCNAHFMFNGIIKGEDDGEPIEFRLAAKETRYTWVTLEFY